MQKGSHIVSLSLGTVAEPSGLVVVDPRTQFSEPNEEYDLEEMYARRNAGRGKQRDSENYFTVPHIKRFPAGCPIPEVVAQVSKLVSDKLLAKKCSTLLDITATGAAPLRVFESRGLYPTAIELTNTAAEGKGGSSKRVPVKDVIGAAQVVVQTRRLQVSDKLQHASTLVGDLQSFDPKSVARGLDLRGGRNCDLVFALAVALWWADELTWDYDPTDRERPRRNLGEHAWMG